MSYFNVFYTDRAQPDSSFVNRAWYDGNKSTLYLELHGSVYRYTNVPQYVYLNLVQADSPGSYYTNHIKGNYGPGLRLGAISNMVEVHQLKGVTPRVQTPAGFAPFALSTTAPATTAVATPQLSLAKDVQEQKKDTRRYEFTFKLSEDGDPRKHFVDAKSEDAALEELFALGKKFDQTFTPVSCTVYYD